MGTPLGPKYIPSELGGELGIDPRFYELRKTLNLKPPIP